MIYCMELAMERLFRKDMKGNYVGAGAAPFFRNVDEHELSKEQVSCTNTCRRLHLAGLRLSH